MTNSKIIKDIKQYREDIKRIQETIKNTLLHLEKIEEYLNENNNGHNQRK